MKQDEKMEQWVEDSLSSFDNAGRATPRPYLLTRIQSRINSTQPGFLEKLGSFISKPAVAFSGLAFLIMVNITVIVYSDGGDITSIVEQPISVPDDFSNTVATIYDYETP